MNKIDLNDESWSEVNGTDSARCRIQWKGTDLCADLHCPCGTSYHFDGFFRYAWKCHNCGSVWQMGVDVKMRRVPDGELESQHDFTAEESW